jgi:hypothetical protein
MLVLLVSASVVRMELDLHDKYLLLAYIVEILLMMDSGPV